MKEITLQKLAELTKNWNWEDFQDEEEEKYWSIMQALYCKLSWVLEDLKSMKGNIKFEEDVEIIEDAMKIVEVLQNEIQI